MGNQLQLRVTAVMPNVDLTEIDASIHSLANTSAGMPAGTDLQAELVASVNRLKALREQIRGAAERDMVHVEFLDDDDAAPVGVAAFLVPRAELRQGVTYNITLTEVTP